MALAANSTIVSLQTSTLNSLSRLPLSKLNSVNQFSSKSNLPPFQNNYQLLRRTLPVAFLAKTSLSDVDLENLDAFTSSDSWSEFAKNISGEWDGFGAEFTTKGSPIELPESVVPEAFREWEVRVFDWQTQCPTLARTEETTMFYKSTKLLPTVGCEADAATKYSIDERIIGGLDNGVSAFAYQSNGCYVAIWPIKDKSTYEVLEMEHCLINPQDRESRVRIIQVLRVEGEKIVLEKIKVFREQWYGPFRNGEQLGGCAIGDSGFAATGATKALDVVGVWQGPTAVVSFPSSQNGKLHNPFQELLGVNIRKSTRDETDTVLLPKQLWCSLKETGQGETCCEAGWVFNQGCAITSRCVVSSHAKLKEISIAQETAVMEVV